MHKKCNELESPQKPSPPHPTPSLCKNYLPQNWPMLQNGWGPLLEGKVDFMKEFYKKCALVDM